MIRKQCFVASDERVGQSSLDQSTSEGNKTVPRSEATSLFKRVNSKAVNNKHIISSLKFGLKNIFFRVLCLKISCII